MSTEHAGIAIVIDQGPKRTIINIPKAEDVETFVLGAPVEHIPGNLWEAVNHPFWSRPVYNPQTGILFRPIGQFTIREEENPWHAHAPDLSAGERAEAARFGIHDEDESEGVW